MVKARSESIQLVGKPLIKEAKTSEEILTGHLVEHTGTGIKKQATAKINAARNFAVVDTVLGKDINDKYAANSNVVYGAFTQGMELQARLGSKVAAVVKGDRLEAKGDGCVQKFTDGIVIGYALEAVDNSSGDDDVLLIMEVA